MIRDREEGGREGGKERERFLSAGVGDAPKNVEQAYQSAPRKVRSEWA